MKFNPDQHHRRSIRLRNYDYAQVGAYFVTLCTQGRVCLFGEVVSGQMRLNEYGLVLEAAWTNTRILRPQVQLDEYVVMPNHFHGILAIFDMGRGVLQYAPTARRVPTFGSPSQTVGAIVRGFKSATTKHINEMRHTPGAPVWQRNYYEHIIRNEDDLAHIRQYILDNPLKWPEDAENPRNVHQPTP
jgi:REP element-mobilizing transposase RayT